MDQQAIPERPHSALPEAVASNAAADLREVIDRLTLLRRNLCVSNIDSEIEAICGFEATGLPALSALTSAANASVLLASPAENKAAALCALAIRAMETANKLAAEANSSTDQAWSREIHRLVGQARQSLSQEWVDALDATPVEASGGESWQGFTVALPVPILSALSAIDRSIKHYTAASAALRQHASPGGPDTMKSALNLQFEAIAASPIKIAQAIFSGDRALSRAYGHIAKFAANEHMWQPLSLIERGPADMPQPAAWRRAMYRISIGLRMPAAIAASVAFKSTGAQAPGWVTDLHSARAIVHDPEYSEAVKRSASARHLKVAGEEKVKRSHPEVTSQTVSARNPWVVNL